MVKNHPPISPFFVLKFATIIKEEVEAKRDSSHAKPGDFIMLTADEMSHPNFQCDTIVADYIAFTIVIPTYMQTRTQGYEKIFGMGGSITTKD